jgi:hypothetical protein
VVEHRKPLTVLVLLHFSVQVYEPLTVVMYILQEKAQLRLQKLVIVMPIMAPRGERESVVDMLSEILDMSF